MAVLPAVKLVRKIWKTEIKNDEIIGSDTAILEKDFTKWLRTLAEKQKRSGIWSKEYVLSDECPRNGQIVDKQIVKGIYYPMHCLLYIYTDKYSNYHRADGNFITELQMEDSDKLDDKKEIEFTHERA
jgi:hypothetical protein